MRRAVVTAFVVAAATAASSAALVAPSTRTVHADVPHLSIVDQDFNLEPDTTLRLTVALPAGLGPADVTGAVVVVTSHEAVTTRARVADVLDGDAGRQVDVVRFTGDAATLRIDGTWQLEVPTETTSRLRAALRLPDPGVFPVGVRVEVGGIPVTDVVTFVHRLPLADEPAARPMRVAVVAALQQSVTLDLGGAVSRPDRAASAVEDLAALLDASAIPVSVTVEPTLLAAMHSAEADEASRRAVALLADALSDHELLSDTSLPLDPSAVAAAGRGDLYTEWLRDGEDLLAATLAVSPSRSTVLVDAPLSTAGGDLLRDLGARLLVLPWQRFTDLTDGLDGSPDLTRLVRIDVGNGAQVDAVVVDHAPLTHLTSTGTVTTVASAVAAVADLLAARQEVIDRGDDPGRRGLTLGLPELGVPELDGFSVFAELLAETPVLAPSSIDELAVRTDVQEVDGTPTVLQLPPTIATDLRARMSTVDALTRSGDATASMLPDGDQRPAEWRRLTGLLPSSALTDDRVAIIAQRLSDEFDSFLDAVEVPTGFGFSLTGRTGTIPVSLHNTSDVPLEVTVQMGSPKLTFPEGPITVVLAPGVYTEVRVAMQARSNGRFPATLLVTTPEGRVPIAPAVPLTATVNALDGLGNLVTGAALLVLLTWWVRHLRRSRRRRLAEAASDSVARHPVHGGPPTGPGQPDDAAATTLPPS